LIKDFIPIAPNQLGVSDIVYIVIGNGLGYLSLITDAFSRKIVGFWLHKTLSAQGVIQVLKRLKTIRTAKGGFITAIEVCNIAATNTWKYFKKIISKSL
jgi:hypothetical protein